MNCRIIVKNFDDTNFVKDLISRKIENNLSFFNLRKINIICNKQNEKINLRLFFDFNKKTIKIQKQGDELNLILDNVINVAIEQIEKYENKINSIIRKNSNYYENIDLDLKKLQQNIVSIKDNINCNSESIIQASKIFISNLLLKKERLSFENACIQLELLGYDLYYYKDMDTNKDMVVYKENDNYILSNVINN